MLLTSYMWLLSTYNVPSVTEEQILNLNWLK